MWSPRWNDIDRGKPKDSKKNLSQCHFVNHKSHWIDPGAIPGRRGERPTTNRQSHWQGLIVVKVVQYVACDQRCPKIDGSFHYKKY
jgi:hypothetical protein